MGFVYRPDGAPLELIYQPTRNNTAQRYWYEKAPFTHCMPEICAPIPRPGP